MLRCLVANILARSLGAVVGRRTLALALVVDVTFTRATRVRRTMSVAFVRNVDHLEVVESGSFPVADGQLVARVFGQHGGLSPHAKGFQPVMHNGAIIIRNRKIGYSSGNGGVVPRTQKPTNDKPGAIGTVNCASMDQIKASLTSCLSLLFP